MKNNDLSRTPNKYELHLLKVLAKSRFLAATEIIEELISTFEVTESNARKILQRAVQSSAISSSKPFSFGKGQFVYFHPADEIDLAGLMPISKKYRPPLYRLLDIMRENGGIISYYEALKVTASPEEKTSSKVSSLNELLELLMGMALIVIREDVNSVRYIMNKELLEELSLDAKQSENMLMQGHYPKMLVDSMFIPDVLRWLTKINLIDQLKTIYRNKKSPSQGASHNNLVWDAYTYTRTTGINPIAGVKADSVEKQTLVALDILVSRNYTHSDLDGFLSRIQIYLNSVKQGIRKALPIVVYQSCSKEVLNKIQALGFLSFDIGLIFGSRIYEVTGKLEALNLKDRQFQADAIEETILSTLTTIRASGQEDNLNEIKGALFEFLLYPLLKTVYPNAEIFHGRTLSITNDGKKEKYEYDYIIQSSNPKEIVVVELKGYSSAASIPLGDRDTKNTLNWFFRRTLPFAQDRFEKEIGQGYKLKSCYITSAGFYEDGRKFLQSINAGKLKPTNLDCFYDGNDLLTLLKRLEFNKAKETIEKFYVQKQNNLQTTI